MKKLIGGMVIGGILVLGFQHLQSKAIVYTIQDEFTAVAECGCELDTWLGFDGSKGDEIVSFGGCDCE